MYKLTIFAAALFSLSNVCSAQVMSKSSKANPSTQGYGTAGTILKDQHTKIKKTKVAPPNPAPGNSAAETAGAATPGNTSQSEVAKRSKD